MTCSDFLEARIFAIIHSGVSGVFTAVGGDVDSPSIYGGHVGRGGANAAPACHAAWCAMTCAVVLVVAVVSCYELPL